MEMSDSSYASATSALEQEGQGVAWVQSRHGSCGKEINILLVQGIKPSNYVFSDVEHINYSQYQIGPKISRLPRIVKLIADIRSLKLFSA
jgi:hypothetical protein